MKINSYSRKSFNYYNDIQLKLAEDQESLSGFIGLPFSLESIEKQIQLKQQSFSLDTRIILKAHFENQYRNIKLSESVQKNIELLGDENSFTITTGQQLTLFGGPAFFFYKIIHCIALTKKLNEKYPKYNFIPLFWLASEDHDKEEISETIIFNQKFSWENDFSGATGQYLLDDNFREIKNAISNFFANHEQCELHRHISKFEGNTLSEGIIRYLNSIFEDYGLLLLDPNSASLKKQLIPIFTSEINNLSTFKNVSKVNESLALKGIKPQAKIQEINFFKLTKNQRLKINFSENNFFIANEQISREQLMVEIENHPESFSPNVFLRPLYQEMILPNIAYIGGPGELSYWLQLKTNFKYFNIPFPLLINRLSVYLIDSATTSKMNNFQFSFLDYLHQSHDELKKNYLLTTKDFEKINWESIDAPLKKTFLSYKEIYSDSTPEIENYLESEWKNIDKSIEKLKFKFQKQIASKHEQKIKQIEQIKNKLIPMSIPQERYYHFFSFCPNGSLELMQKLINQINPLSTDVLVVNI
jgi:bacillithiol biosynthesis cysteine-adding enzyme BshC